MAGSGAPGAGVVTVRFETAETPAGPVRSYAEDDPRSVPGAEERTRGGHAPGTRLSAVTGGVRPG